MIGPTAARILRAITDELAERNLEDCAGGTVSAIVQVDRSGCPRRITIKTEVEREVERKRPNAQCRVP